MAGSYRSHRGQQLDPAHRFLQQRRAAAGLFAFRRNRRQGVRTRPGQVAPAMHDAGSINLLRSCQASPHRSTERDAFASSACCSSTSAGELASRTSYPSKSSMRATVRLTSASSELPRFDFDADGAAPRHGVSSVLHHLQQQHSAQRYGSTRARQPSLSRIRSTWTSAPSERATSPAHRAIRSFRSTAIAARTVAPDRPQGQVRQRFRRVLSGQGLGPPSWPRHR